MGRKKQRGEVKQMIIELDMNVPAQKALWGYWQKLAESGQASQWARETLTAGMTPKRASAPAVSRSPVVQSYPKPSARVTNGNGVRYEKVEDEA